MNVKNLTTRNPMFQGVLITWFHHQGCFITRSFPSPGVFHHPEFSITRRYPRWEGQRTESLSRFHHTKCRIQDNKCFFETKIWTWLLDKLLKTTIQAHPPSSCQKAKFGKTKIQAPTPPPRPLYNNETLSVFQPLNPSKGPTHVRRRILEWLEKKCIDWA